MIKKVLLLVAVFAILSVSAVTALEKNLGRFDLVLNDNFEYGNAEEGGGYISLLNHHAHNNVNLFSGHRIAAGETYTVRMRFTASRDLEEDLEIFLVDNSEAGGWWNILSNDQVVEGVRANREVSVTFRFTTTKAASSSSPAANVLSFGTKGQGRVGVAGSGVRGPVTLRFTEFVLTGGPAQPVISFPPTAFMLAANWDVYTHPDGIRGSSVQSRRENIQRVQREVISFTSNLPRTADYNHVQFHNWRLKELLPFGSGIRFKVLGDRGEGWFLTIATTDVKDHVYHVFPINTVNGQIVEIDIPFSALRQDDWGVQVPFNKNNIDYLTITRRAFDDTVSGASTIKIFDFEIY